MEELTLSQALVDLADPLAEGSDEADHLGRLCHAAARVLQADEAIVHLARGDGLALAAASHPERPLPERLADPQDGPAATSFQVGVPVHVADAVPGRPTTTLLSVPLRRAGQRLGVLTLVRLTTAAFTAEQARGAQALADIGAIRLSAARALAEAETLSLQLRHALDSRILIEQAKGVIAANDGMDMDAAFTQLRTYSRRNGVRLRDAALAVVEGRLKLNP